MATTETRATARTPADDRTKPRDDGTQRGQEMIGVRPKPTEQGQADVATDDKETGVRYTQFLENAWQHYAHAKLETHKALDDYLLKFATGAFAVSLAPTIPVFQWATAKGKGTLFGAWIAFGMTIAATLVSMYTSAKACDQEVSVTYSLMVERKQRSEIPSNRPLRWTKWLNEFSIGSFLLGLVLLAAYLGMNF